MTTVAEQDTKHNDSSASPYCTVRDVAKILGVPTSTVYDLARQNRIGGQVRFGRHIRFNRNRLETWLESGGEGSHDDA